MNKSTPVRGLIVAILAVPTGSAVLAVAGNRAGVFDADILTVWLVVFGFTLLLPGSAYLVSALPSVKQKRVYPLERRTVPNRAPKLPDTLIVTGNHGEYWKPNKQIITPEIMRTLSHGVVKQGKGLSRSDWVGSVFTRAEYIAIRDELISEHVIEWAGLGRNAGLEITPKGERVFSFWHKVLHENHLPSEISGSRGPKLSRLANQPTNLPTYKNN